VDDKQQEKGDHEEASKMESPAQLQATSLTRRNVDMEGRCAVCQYEFSKTRELEVINPWYCEHQIHSECWNMWKGPANHSSLMPPCAFCRVNSRPTRKEVELELALEAWRAADRRRHMCRRYQVMVETAIVVVLIWLLSRFIPAGEFL
jgi:hypothetical protein